MGKNFTLYVSVPQFGEEPNKSGLVNQLLASHYVDARTPEQRAAQPKATISYSSHADPAFYGTALIPQPNVAIGICPHGYGIGMCRKADCNRKYAK